MELKIMSPQEEGFIKEIQWNHEELKAEIAAKMNDYNSLVFTEETIKEAKADRANLRKLKEAFETELKRIKKKCMEPYDRFEKQVKEVTVLIDEPIRLIDTQIKEVEEKRRDQKMQGIQELFDEMGFQSFVTLEKIFDLKWLNASVPMKKVEESMQEIKNGIGQDVFTIHQLPEFSFEAMETYKRNLDLNQAVQEGQRLSDIQKRKKAYEEQEKRRREEEAALAARQKAEENRARESTKKEEKHKTEAQEAEVEKETNPEQEKFHVIDFRVSGTAEQLVALKEFMIKNRIQYGPVPKKGE